MNETAQNNNERAVKQITSAAFISIFVYSIVVSIPGVLINEVVDAFSLSGTDEGLMGALTSLGFLLSMLFVVMIQGRFKKTVVLASAFVVQSFALFFCGFSPTFLLFCIFCTLIGFSGGFIDTFTNSSVVDLQTGDNTKSLGFLHGLFGVGSLLSPLLFVWLLQYTDWRGSHYMAAIASVLVAVLVFTLTNRSGKDLNENVVREHLFTKADLLAYLRVKRNAALAFSGFFAMFSIAAVLVWIVRYMTLQYNAAELGALSITVYWICSTINRFLFVHFTKRAPMLFFSLGAVLSGICVIVGVFSGNPVILCVMMGAFGLCSGHFIPVLISECAAGYEGRTTFTTSFIMFVMCIARVISPIIMAFTSTQVSLSAGMMIPVAATLAAAGCGWLSIKQGVKKIT